MKHETDESDKKAWTVRERYDVYDLPSTDPLESGGEKGTLGPHEDDDSHKSSAASEGVTGIVYDRLTYRPVEDASVTLKNVSSAKTNEKGGFTIVDIKPGAHRITFSKTGYVTQSHKITVVGGEIVELEVHIIPLCLAVNYPRDTMEEDAETEEEKSPGSDVEPCPLASPEKAAPPPGEKEVRVAEAGKTEREEPPVQELEEKALIGKKKINKLPHRKKRGIKDQRQIVLRGKPRSIGSETNEVTGGKPAKEKAKHSVGIPTVEHTAQDTSPSPVREKTVTKEVSLDPLGTAVRESDLFPIKRNKEEASGDQGTKDLVPEKGVIPADYVDLVPAEETQAPTIALDSSEAALLASLDLTPEAEALADQFPCVSFAIDMAKPPQQEESSQEPSQCVAPIEIDQEGVVQQDLEEDLCHEQPTESLVQDTPEIPAQDKAAGEARAEELSLEVSIEAAVEHPLVDYDLIQTPSEPYGHEGPADVMIPVEDGEHVIPEAIIKESFTDYPENETVAEIVVTPEDTGETEPVEGTIFLSDEEIGALSRGSSSVEVSGLAGFVSAQPNPVFRGLPVTLVYSLTNVACDDLDDLVLQIVVTNPDKGLTQEMFEVPVKCPKGTSSIGGFVVSTISYEEPLYRVGMQIVSGKTKTSQFLVSIHLGINPIF